MRGAALVLLIGVVLPGGVAANPSSKRTTGDPGGTSLIVEVHCPPLDPEGVAEIETRLLLESELRPGWTGHLRLLCRAGHAIGERIVNDPPARRRTTLLDDRSIKDALLRLAFELLDDDLLKAPSLTPATAASGDTPSDPPNHDPVEESSKRRGASPSSSPRSHAVRWGIDAALVYEHLANGHAGTLGMEVGGVRSLDELLGLRLFVGGALGLQPIEDLRTSGVAFGAALELRPLAWLVVGASPFYSVLQFSGGEHLVTDDPRSAQWGGQLDLGLAPAEARSGMTIAFRIRRYAQSRSVRVDGVEALHLPPWTASVTLGYRFYAEP